MTGKVRKIFKEKGFGFIKNPDFRDGLFFHVTKMDQDIFDQLEEGDSVSFEIEDTNKGPAGINIQNI